jgi:hypothetical protein
MHEWLDSWSGVGRVVVGMAHQGYDLQLTAYVGRDWRANFFTTGIAHSILGGSGWEPTARRAVQQAAWEALTKRETRPGQALVSLARR